MAVPLAALAAKMAAAKAVSVATQPEERSRWGRWLLIGVSAFMVITLVVLVAVVSAVGALVQIRDTDACLPPDIQALFDQTQGEVLDADADAPMETSPVSDTAVAPVVSGTGSVVFPVPNGLYRLTSPYGMRKHPIRGGMKMHHGMDFGSQPRGSNPPILAVAAGRVVVSEFHSSWGSHVRIEHNINGQKWLTLYAHMVRPASVRVGDTVTAGQQIGNIGSTGSSSGEHLHLEVWKNSTRTQSTDPAPWLKSNGVVNTASPIGGSGGSADGGTGAVVCESTGGAGTGTAGGAGPWGGHENGKIPAGELCAPKSAPNHRFRCDAARAFDALSADYAKRFGSALQITDSYRDYAGQVRCREQKGALCAKPGTSNHGWAMAMDAAGGVEKFGTPQHQWMTQNAARHGWTHPSWAQQSGSKPEPWHWEYTGTAPTAGTGDMTTVAGAQAYARSAVLRRGWAETEYSQCLAPLWHKESTWNYKAKNPTSSAVGIPQMMGSIWLKDATLRAEYLRNPRVQIDMGLNYIADRYGKPCAAWDHSKRLNWY